MRYALKTLRLLAAYLLACAAAGITQAAFVVTPADLITASADDRLARLGGAALLAAFAMRDTALFAAPLALVATAYDLEHRLTRPLRDYALTGGAIALLAVMALSSQPAGFPGLYASAAYLASGLAGGTVYGLLAMSRR